MNQNSDDLFLPHMPEIDTRPDIESIFKRARKAAAEPNLSTDGVYHRQIIIVTPGRLLIGKDCPLASELTEEQIARLEKWIPRSPTKQIGVIAYTFIDALKKDMRRTIPFIDYLLGFSAIGHSVWVFEGHPGSLAAGCRDADLLLVDSGMLPELDKNPDWQKVALGTMREKEIKLVKRA
jgi:hypothetical protein